MPMFSAPRLYFPFACALLILLRAAPALADPYSRMAKSLTKDMKALKGKTVAIVPFSDTNGRASVGGAAVAIFLETQIAKRGKLRLVERSLLNKVLDELKLHNTGLISKESTLKIGRISGADLLITGTVTDVGSTKVEVHARLLQVETGEVLRAVKARVSQKWPDRSMPATTPAAPPNSHATKIQVASSRISEAARRIGDRDITFRYAYQGSKPVIRMMDYTDGNEGKWREIRIPNFPDGLKCAPFAKNFRLSDRKYRMWMDLECKLHVAPRSNIFSEIFLTGIIKEQETIISHGTLLQSWLDDIDDHSRSWYFSNGQIVTAYVEPLKKSKMRISVFLGQRTPRGEKIMDFNPRDTDVLRPRGGRAVSSRLLKADSKYFRFHYNADSRSVTVEQVGGEEGFWLAQERP